MRTFAALTGRILPFFIGLTMSLTLINCSSQHTDKPASDEGTSSGGGGFGDQNSIDLLNWVKGLTATAIRRINPKVLANLPPRWTQERFAKLIENVRLEPNKVVYRYGRELMFDYRVPKNGEPYLIATSLFFRSHAAIPVGSLVFEDLEAYYRNIRKLLLHEAAHVFDIGITEKTNDKAEVFAIYFNQEILGKNNVACSASDVPESYPGRVSEDKLMSQAREKALKMGITDEKQITDFVVSEVANIQKEKPYYWMVNRPWAFALEARRSPSLTNYSNIRELLTGTPMHFYSFARSHILRPEGSDFAYFKELKRYYSPVSLLADQEDTDERATQQYFRDYVKSDDGLLTMKSDDTPLKTSKGNSFACVDSEAISFPFEAKGSEFTGEVHFNFDCDFHTKADGTEVQNVKRGTIPVKCVESFVVMPVLTEFIGDQDFTDSLLIDIKNNLRKLE